MDLSPEKKQKIKSYYLQEEVIAEMVRVAKHREFAPTYPYGYGKRPDAVNFPGDFKNFVNKGAIAFHGSVERWRNPHLIDTVDSDELRTGWDLVMDIDCDEDDDDLILSKITALAVVEELEELGVKNYSIKFSGNRGFHIGVRSEAFPDKIQGKKIEHWYPDLLQVIVNYLRHRVNDQHKLAKNLRKHRPDLYEDIYDTNLDMDKVQADIKTSPFGISDIENHWGDRHLFRMPYSINEKSWLVSLPLERDEIMDFEKPDAEIDEVTVETTFLEGYEENEAVNLAIEALDWKARQPQPREEKKTFDGDFDIPDEAIEEEHFPPTIRNILNGLEDGRKRALFILLGFLPHCGYDWESVERMIWEWNERNEEPLDTTYIDAQLNWMKSQDSPLMPPNFDAKGYYKDLGVYEEDSLTRNVNNPVAYAFAKKRDAEEEDDDGEKKQKGKKSEKEIVECPYCGKEYKGETKWYRDHVQQCDA